MRCYRNKQPREISRISLESGHRNFLPRLLAALLMVDGADEFRRKAFERSGAINRELGTAFGFQYCQSTAGALNVAELYLVKHGKMVQSFGPVDAARIWAAGPHGEMDAHTIPYWRNVEKFFRSSMTTAALMKLAALDASMGKEIRRL